MTNKGFYGFEFAVDNDTGAVSFSLAEAIQMERSTEQPLTGMDSESIAFIKGAGNGSDADSSFFLVGQEGHTTYSTENQLYLYSTDGAYLDTITDQLNVKFRINNTESNRGLEGLAVDDSQMYVVYTTERPLLSDRTHCADCLRFSVNHFAVDNGTVELNELYELRLCDCANVRIVFTTVRMRARLANIEICK